MPISSLLSPTRLQVEASISTKWRLGRTFYDEEMAITVVRKKYPTSLQHERQGNTRSKKIKEGQRVHVARLSDTCRWKSERNVTTPSHMVEQYLELSRVRNHTVCKNQSSCWLSKVAETWRTSWKTCQHGWAMNPRSRWRWWRNRFLIKFRFWY